MKIGFFTSVDGWGGSEAYLDTMIAGVLESGHEPVLFGIAGTRLARLCRERGVTVHCWKTGSSGAGSYICGGEGGGAWAMAKEVDDGARHVSASEPPVVSGAVPTCGPGMHRRTGMSGRGDVPINQGFRHAILQLIPWPVKLILGNAREAVRLARLFRRNPVDVMHVNVHGYEMAGVACRLAGIPCVGVYHIWPVTESYRVRRFLVGVTARSYDVFVAPSDPTLDAWVRAYCLNPKKCRSVLNGIDVGKYAMRSPRQTGKTFRLLAVGRLDPIKDYGTLLKAVALLPDTDMTLTIAGDGPQRESLEEMASSLGIQEKVRFLGHVDDTVALYHEADCFVMSSRTEASPLALMEAMASGLPAVTSDGGVLPSLNRDGETGRVFTVGDTRGCARVLTALALDPQTRSAMGTCGRARAGSLFQRQRMVVDMLAVYGSLDRKDETRQVWKGNRNTHAAHWGGSREGVRS